MAIFRFREKARKKFVFLPYRKPTLVGSSRRRRLSEELWLRNSAKKLGVT